MGLLSKISEASLLFNIGDYVYCAKTNHGFQIQTISADQYDLKYVLGTYFMRKPKRYLYWEKQWATRKRRHTERPLRRAPRMDFYDIESDEG